MNQTNLILDYLDEYGSIDPLEALRELGCFRLAARIYDLEQRGHVIPRETFTTVGRKTGRKVRFTRYKAPERSGL